MTFSRGDRVIATDAHDRVRRGTIGVVEAPGGPLGPPKVCFEDGVTVSYPPYMLGKL